MFNKTCSILPFRENSFVPKNIWTFHIEYQKYCLFCVRFYQRINFSLFTCSYGLIPLIIQVNLFFSVLLIYSMIFIFKSVRPIWSYPHQPTLLSRVTNHIQNSVAVFSMYIDGSANCLFVSLQSVDICISGFRFYFRFVSQTKNCCFSL